MLLLLLNYVVLRALWKIDVHLIRTLVNKSVYYYYYYYYYVIYWYLPFVSIVEKLVRDSHLDILNIRTLENIGQ